MGGGCLQCFHYWPSWKRLCRKEWVRWKCRRHGGARKRRGRSSKSPDDEVSLKERSLFPRAILHQCEMLIFTFGKWRCFLQLRTFEKRQSREHEVKLERERQSHRKLEHVREEFAVCGGEGSIDSNPFVPSAKTSVDYESRICIRLTRGRARTGGICSTGSIVVQTKLEMPSKRWGFEGKGLDAAVVFTAATTAIVTFRFGRNKVEISFRRLKGSHRFWQQDRRFKHKLDAVRNSPL